MTMKYGIIKCFAISALLVSNAIAHESAHDDELAQAIDVLVKDVEQEPSTHQTIESRLETFWRWANSYALHGYPIDPDVPSTVARIRDPGPNTQIASTDIQDIDRWVREFAYREANPKSIGSLSTPKLGPFEVDSHHTLIVEYTVGDRALEVGDGFVLGELTYGKGPLLQGRFPDQDNFVSIASSHEGADFEIDHYPIRGIFSGTMARSVIMTGPARKVFFRLKKGRVPAGEKITIKLGDQSFGSRGIGLIGPSVDALRFRVWLHLEREDLLMTLPELEFYSVGSGVVGVRGFAPSVVGVGERFEVSVRFEDEFRNRATGEMPAVRIFHNENVIASAPKGRKGVILFPNIQFGAPGVYRLRVEADDIASIAEVNPILVKKSPETKLLWGETHGHSGFSEGMGSVNGVYEFARDDARLDFMALTEHDYWMDDAEWEVLRKAAQRYNEPGKFLAFLAYEWTVHAKHGGHHNIIFRTPEDRARVPRQEAQTLDVLYETLLANNDSKDILLIPHAHNPGDWGMSESATERFVEIVSLHGTFEWFGRRYLDEGFLVGFLGGSDDHMGHPGLRPLRRNPTSDNYGGLLGLYASDKTNDAVFDAMREINGYATNGIRAILDLELNGQKMGRKVRASELSKITGSVHGTAPIAEISLIKNGEVVHNEDLWLDRNNLDQQRRFVEIRFWSDSYPRAKGELARQWRRWRGTLSVSGAKVMNISSPQNDNPFTEFVRPRNNESTVYDFFLKTRGSYKSLLLELDRGDVGGALRISGLKESPLPTEAAQTYEYEVELSDLGLEQKYVGIPVEGYDDHFVVREVFPATMKDVDINILHEEAQVKGDYYYLRVRQDDGGLIWSSPFRVE